MKGEDSLYVCTGTPKSFCKKKFFFLKKINILLHFSAQFGVQKVRS